MQIRSRIWTRRNEIWWRRRTWRTEDREIAVVSFFFFFWRVVDRGKWMYLRRDVFIGDHRWKVLYLRLFSPARRGGARGNAVKTDFFGGIKSRAGGCSPLIVSTLCRGSAAVSGERAPSCRCPRAGRKPGITTAECFISTTTPGKLHGLTPEIGMPRPGSSGITHTHTKTC